MSVSGFAQAAAPYAAAPHDAASNPPGRTETALSTFLFTDVEGSTRLWETHPVAMRPALAQHDRLLRTAIETRGGTVVKTTGDGILASFPDPMEAIGSALSAQRALRDATWGETGPVRVRMALHAGTAEAREGDFFGPTLNRVARILSIGHGGQILCSAVVAILAGDWLPTGIELVDLGAHRLRDIDRPERVYQVAVDDLPRAFPPLRSVSERRSNLPVQLTSFVGREPELAEIRDLIGRHRLVTVIGTGGTGKTRLMLEAAGGLLDRFPDGVWLAELAPLRDPTQIISEVARAIGAPEVPGVPAMATVSAFLGEKELLLLLDNAEHVVEAVAELAEALLAHAPGLKILTTSREALAITGEAVIHLKSLSCPAIAARSAGVPDPVDLEAAASTEAVRLFTERAIAVDPAFVLRESNVASVAEICRRLDGIPLALELAAARVSAMSTEDIALRLGDRFRLLTGGRRTAVPRQQTLHALIDWSWDLLTDDDRQLLRRLSVFTGGWTVPFAARIVGDGPDGMDPVDLLDGLSRLVDRSLVIADRGTTTRYRMLETIRQYAREKLVAAGEAESISNRHLAVYAQLAVDADEPIHGPAMADWLDRLDPELDNLVAALDWGLEAEPWTAVRMATALLGYWSVRVMSEDNDARIVAATELARARVMGNPDADPAEQILAARLLGQAAWLWSVAGRGTGALPWALDAMAIADAIGDPTARLYATAGLAITSVFTGRAGPQGAEFWRLFEEAGTLAEQLGQWWMLASASAFSGSMLIQYDRELGEALLERGVEAARRSGNPHAIGSTSLAQGRALGHVGRTDEAVAASTIAGQRFIELGDERFVLAARSDMAHSLRRGGRFVEALAIYRETLPAWVHLGSAGAVANQLENVAYIAVERGDNERAARLLGAAAGIRDRAHAMMAFGEDIEFAAAVERLREAMTSASFEAAHAAGLGLSQSDAVALAIR